MKTTLLLFVFCSFTYLQANNIETNDSDSVSFVTILNIENATKEGIYMDDYVVYIKYNDAKKLNGRKVKVSGKVTIVKGLDNMPKEYNSEGIEIIKQGRNSDTKHIIAPLIEVIED